MNRVFLIGYMGSGKTTMGKLLAPMLEYEFVDMDAYIEEKYHKSVTQIFADEGEEKFRQIERQCLHEIAEFEKVVIATGGGAPCFFDNMEFMNQQGMTVYIKMTAEQLSARLETSRPGKRPLIEGKKGEELRAFIQAGLAKREPFYDLAKIYVTGTDDDMATQIKSFFQQI